MLDIARNHWMCGYDIKAVFVDTGLEYSEIRKFVKTFDNVALRDSEQAKKLSEVMKSTLNSIAENL